MTNLKPRSEPQTYTPTQELLLDVLAARCRLGENLWTFGSHLSKAAEQLADRGLVVTTHGITEKTIRVGLTEAGKAETMSPDYSPPPIIKHLTEQQLVHGLEYAAMWTERGNTAVSRSYWEGMRDTLRVALGLTTHIPSIPSDDAAAAILLGGHG